MMTAPLIADFRLHLQHELIARCKRNSHYSLRAFAKSLQINHSTLSQILRGTRPLSLKTIRRLGTALGMGPHELTPFFGTLASSHNSSETPSNLSADVRTLSLDTFAVISDWYHDAIVELTRLPFFESNPKWVARKLGITVAEVNAAVERLVRLDLIEIQKDGTWVELVGDSNTVVADDFTNVALRKLQKQILELSILALEETDKTNREHSSMCMAVNSADIIEVKKRIRKFRQNLCEYLQRKQSFPDNVYQLAISYFPLTKINSKTEVTQ